MMSLSAIYQAALTEYCLPAHYLLLGGMELSSMLTPHNFCLLQTDKAFYLFVFFPPILRNDLTVRINFQLICVQHNNLQRDMMK